MSENEESVKAPFPWFGGKSRAAEIIWRRFGDDIGNYCEPFFGSGAVWFARPAAVSCWSVVNDLDGNLANFWRSVKYRPNETAEAACWPVNECDLHARHLRLVRELPNLAERLMADPDYCDPVLAGWWAWGACVWIGGSWCGGDGPWGVDMDEEGVPVFRNTVRGVSKRLQHLGNGDRGVNRKLPHLGDGGRGVNRKLPHLGDGGRGVNRKLPHLGGGRGVNRLAWLQAWFNELSESLIETRVSCGDWRRICSVGTLTISKPTAVMLDPPYGQTDAVYAHDSSTVSGDVRRWCIENGANKDLRIALCGHDGEHNELQALGWEVVAWTKSGGYANNRDERERIWFSPGCVRPNTRQPELF